MPMTWVCMDCWCEWEMLTTMIGQLDLLGNFTRSKR